MNEPTDVIVVGAGVMGAAVSLELARRGVGVIAVDARTPPHDQGSSHGRTRIIREAYFEHPLYVPLVQRAWELWEELEELTGTTLYRRTGGLMVGPEDGLLVRGTLASARAHGLLHELLDAGEIARRFPGLLPEPGHVGVFETRAGMLLSDACMRTLSTVAAGYGARLRPGVRVDSWHVASSGDVVLHTSGGELRARQAVFAAGPWLNHVLASETSPAGDAPLVLPLTVERQTSHWFAPAQGVHSFRVATCPITIWEHAPARYFYTLPDAGHGLKVGIHHEGAIVDPDHVDRNVAMAEDERVRRLLDTYMPGSAQRMLDATVCLYTSTPDHHFVVDRHATHEQVMLVSACSGHGFKFAPAIGEAAPSKF